MTSHLVVAVELVTGAYDAADSEDRRLAEWPPHPARLFCSLVSVARGEDERSALRWLEQQGPPLVAASVDHSTSRTASYVVTNQRSLTGGSQFHPGRSNQLRSRSRVFPGSSRIEFVWQVAPDQQIIAHLDAMCARVPYLGRATGMATLTASRRAAEIIEEVDVFEPVPDDDKVAVAGQLMLRTPYPGYLAALDEQYELDMPAWLANRFTEYRLRSDPEDHVALRQVHPSLYRDVVILRFVNLRPQGRLGPEFVEALRSSVLRSAGPNAPGVLHGHGADGRPHVAFLALPNVAPQPVSRTSDAWHRSWGHLLGIAVAVPELDAAERRAVLSAVLGLRRLNENNEQVITLEIDRIGAVQLRYEPTLIKPFGVTPERWRRSARCWSSVSPVVLDKYPRRSMTAEDIVLGSVRQAGLPEPVDISVSRSPLLPGASQLQPIDLPKKFRGRLFRHVTLTFAEEVAGPVLIGAGRYLGLGLMAPVSGKTDRDAGGESSDPATEDVIDLTTQVGAPSGGDL
ncbi:type I-U CRISPR-associated protein Cas5/Cas6 [Kineosporia sp. J2-2]|uniref:Type I-U CRISPR-associated protein Cas5/Cas6 n=1 Tax=Kineosporia corallincola TaxID=2835133 RepID=A0ABS5TTU3_9ACTN|nr:type I-U CRISPR-associated protein Csb2 [Kineosporia corallincola]MBT0774159.1 type I-U CRISPR-associated protein Cas5/Cas6 [Kineosporia corallincola]